MVFRTCPAASHQGANGLDSECILPTFILSQLCVQWVESVNDLLMVPPRAKRVLSNALPWNEIAIIQTA